MINPFQHACGIILAAGEGKRLQSFIHGLRGDNLPKQYVSFIGTRSMLEHTFTRAEKLVRPDRLFTVVAKDHLVKFPEVRKQLAGRPRGTVIIQPENKETGAGLLFPLMHAYKRYPGSVVVVFPSDHFILEEHLFVSDLYLAIKAVMHDPSRLILMGMQPGNADPEYGYILPGENIESVLSVGFRRVASFVEKPDAPVAWKLAAKGGLWNSMIMVFKDETLFEMIRQVSPQLYLAFDTIRRAIGTPEESSVVEKAYGDIRAVNFSKDILEVIALKYPASLAVFPARDVCWSDWGSAERVIRVLRKTGRLIRLNGCDEAQLIKIWEQSKPAANTSDFSERQRRSGAILRPLRRQTESLKRP
jgi:mannose-1-phosphate guanylyltransferase